MKIIIRFLLLIVIAGSTSVALWQFSTFELSSTKVKRQQNKDEDVLRIFYQEEIDQAKASGHKEIILPAIFYQPFPEVTFEQIIRSHSFLRIKVLDEETVVYNGGSDIKTWYKLEIIESVHQQSTINDEPLFEEVPDRLLPLLPSECLLVVQGGTVQVDGIKITRLFNQEDVSFDLDKEYFIAAHLDHNSKFLSLIAHKSGAFLVDGSALKPLSTNDSQLVKEVRELFQNNLEHFRGDKRFRQELKN